MQIIDRSSLRQKRYSAEFKSRILSDLDILQTFLKLENGEWGSPKCRFLCRLYCFEFNHCRCCTSILENERSVKRGKK